jgi:hypothetical protein
MPTRYRIHFGAPLRFEGDGDEEDEVIAAQVAEVRSTIQAMLDRGVAEREGIFT